MKRFKQFVKESTEVDEDLASSFMKTMHAAGKTNVRLVDRDQKRRETDELMRKRAADAAKRPAEPAHRSAEKYPLGGADEKSGRSYSEEVEQDVETKRKELIEMDKSQPSSDRGGESSGDPYAKGGKGKLIKPDQVSKDATKFLQRLLKKSRKTDAKKSVAEGSDSVDQELVRRQGEYWNKVAKERKDKEKAVLRAKQSDYKRTPQGKAEKYWSEQGVAEDLDEASAAWQRKEGKNPTGGLNKKGIASYRRENPGSKLSMAVTTEPSKLKKGSKAWNRRKSFCARMGGMPGPMKDEKGRPTRKALSLRKWNC